MSDYFRKLWVTISFIWDWGGGKFVIAPPFRRKGGAPAALHTPGYGPGLGSKMLADAELQPSSVRGGEDITAAVN